MNTQSIIDEYTPEYCQLIEMAYGKNWMSDGGTCAIDHMFLNTNLKNKKILDIGSGLGGPAFYLAENFGASVTGLEINPWLTKEATRRTPKSIASKVSFKSYDDTNILPFYDDEFDIVFSLGVLVHIKNKQPLFNEIFRVLNTNGSIAIYDWLAPPSGQWGANLMEMCVTEGLVLETTTESEYINTLKNTNFKNIALEDLNKTSSEANFKIAKKLETNSLEFLKKFSEKDRLELQKGHQNIGKSMQSNELLARNIFANKIQQQS